MNVLRSRFKYIATVVLLTAVSVDAKANIPDIELAPGHVEGYIQCIQAAYAANSWRSTTVAECRASNPAVQALRQGDYVALTLSTAQSRLYDQSWKRWVDFDKSLKSQIFSSGLAQMFNAAGVQTAYSFNQVSADLTARFSELDAPPFSWYPGQKPAYKTATGLSLQQLHAAELDRFSRCLGAAVSTLDVMTASQQSVETQAATCTRAITKLNADNTQGVYGASDFSRVANQYWAQIASSQAHAKEVERVRLEQEKANSWPVRLKALAGQALVFLMVFAGLFVAYRVIRNLASVTRDEQAGLRNAGQRRSRRRSEEEDEYEPVRDRRQSPPLPRKPDLGTFTLNHKKVCSPTTRHMCASCRWWGGQRTPHPVTPELYVKVGTVGKCTHRHTGSPHGMKRYDSGTICKDFEDLGV